MSKIRIHVHLCHTTNGTGVFQEGRQYAFLAGAISDINLWLCCIDRKPLYAINILPKEVTSGDRHQEGH